jgi:hypothetical protein
MTSLDRVARFGLGHRMYLEAVLERVAAKTPVTVMTRAALEHALAPADLDALFAQKAVPQYERSLLVSSIVDLMGMVVAKVQPSLHAAYQAVADTLPVSITSVYNKLNPLEPEVVAAMVRHTAARLRPVIEANGGAHAPWLPGYRVRILDGNHLAARLLGGEGRAIEVVAPGGDLAASNLEDPHHRHRDALVAGGEAVDALVHDDVAPLELMEGLELLDGGLREDHLDPLCDRGLAHERLHRHRVAHRVLREVAQDLVDGLAPPCIEQVADKLTITIHHTFSSVQTSTQHEHAAVLVICQDHLGASQDHRRRVP